MWKIVETNFTPEHHLEALDLQLASVLQAAGATITPEAYKQLRLYERRLRIALGLPVEVPN